MGGGTGGRTPGGGGGGPDSSDSDESSEPDLRRDPEGWERWFKSKRALYKARKGKRAVPRSDLSDAEEEPKHQGRMEKVEAFSGESSSYDVEDFLWNLGSKFAIEKRAWTNDQTKIRYASSCLTGKARTWFRGYRVQVNPGEAKRAGRDSLRMDPKFWTWAYFEAQLRRSFGSKDQKEAALRKWDALTHTGTIDEFCNEVELLMWIVGLNQTAIEHKIRSSLKYELRKDWAKVQNKPASLLDQLSLLREMGRPIEQFNKDNRKPEKEGTASSSTGGKRKREQDTTSRPAKKSRQESRPFGRFPSKEEALKGIPKDVLDQRMAAKACWRCGRAGHRATDCTAAAPVTAKVAASGGKGKERRKESRTVSAAAKVEEEEQTAVASSSTKFIELPSDTDMSDY